MVTVESTAQAQRPTQSFQLTLQIPFILLGHHGIDPELYTHEERHVKPIKTVYQMLRNCCPDILLQSYIPQPLELLGRAGHGALREYENEENEKRRRAWRAAENATWENILAYFNREGAHGGWVLRRADTNSEPGVGILGGWREGDGMLTTQENELKGNQVWACPMLLQRIRLGLGKDDMGRFSKETGALTHWLIRLSDYVGEKEEGRETVKRRWWSIVCGERCHLSIGIFPDLRKIASTTGTDEDETRNPVLDITIATNLLLLFTACERELTTLSTPTSLLTFWSQSRFLLHRSVKLLRLEKRNMWRRHRANPNVSEKRRGKEYGREKKKWVEAMDREDKLAELLGGKEGGYRGNKGWWEIIDELRELGEERVGELLREMDQFNKEKPNGNDGACRLGINFLLIKEDKERVTLQKNGEIPKIGKDGGDSRSTGKLGTTSTANDEVVKESQNVSSSKIHSLITSLRRRSSTPPPIRPRPPLTISGFILQGHRSTLDAAELTAYTELISKLVVLAFEIEYDVLRDKVKCLKEAMDSEDLNPIESLERCMRMLGVGQKTYEFWVDTLTPSYATQGTHESELSQELYHWQDKDNGQDRGNQADTRSLIAEKKTPLPNDPFVPLETYVATSLTNSKAYTPTFVRRYDFAGGFHVTLRSKLYSLMQAEDRVRELSKREEEASKHEGKGEMEAGLKVEGWMDGMDQEIGVGEGWREAFMSTPLQQGPQKMQGRIQRVHDTKAMGIRKVEEWTRGIAEAHGGGT